MPFRKDRSGITLKLYPLSLLAGRAAGLRQDDGQRLAATAPLNASFLGGRDLCTEGIERLRLVGALELESKFLPRSLLGRSLEERLGNFVVTAQRVSWQSWFGSSSVQDMGNCYTGQSQERATAAGVGEEFR